MYDRSCLSAQQILRHGGGSIRKLKDCLSLAPIGLLRSESSHTIGAAVDEMIENLRSKSVFDQFLLCKLSTNQDCESALSGGLSVATGILKTRNLEKLMS